MLQARFLGQFEIHMDGQPVIIPSRPTQSLLAYLLLHPKISHRREKLAGQFWPTSSESNARSNLRHELWRIRKAIGPGANARLESDDLGVTYHPLPGDQLDVDSFEACSEDEGSVERLLLAVSAYGGELLPGFYEDWVILERERLQAAFERKLGRLLDRLLAEKRWNEVLEWGEHWVASGSIPEPAYRAIMLAHAGLGLETAPQPFHWSRDGRYLYYTSLVVPDGGCGYYANSGESVDRLDLSDGSIAALQPPYNRWMLSISPDEARLAYLSFIDGYYLIVRDLEGAYSAGPAGQDSIQWQIPLDLAAPRVVSQIDWSPDGQQVLVWVADIAGNCQPARATEWRLDIDSGNFVEGTKMFLPTPTP